MAKTKGFSEYNDKIEALRAHIFKLQIEIITNNNDKIQLENDPELDPLFKSNRYKFMRSNVDVSIKMLKDIKQQLTKNENL